MKSKNNGEDDRRVLFTSFRAGIIALVFLILGFQLALFMHRAAETRILANRDCPDTVYVGEVRPDSQTGRREEPPHAGAVPVQRHNSDHAPAVERIRSDKPPRSAESFRFDPNTVSVDDLVRLGFSPKQAEAIDSYRLKGGRFRRRSDFAKSYVVADSVYRRLEPFIDIPLVDINRADSAAFDSLPGIGGWFASRMVSYRSQLGGYSCKEQLMEIYHFDRERFEALEDLITVSPPSPFRLWTLPADSLRLHPHIGSWQTARAIVLYRDNNPDSLLTVDGLRKAGILTENQASGLARCLIEKR